MEEQGGLAYQEKIKGKAENSNINGEKLRGCENFDTEKTYAAPEDH